MDLLSCLTCIKVATSVINSRYLATEVSLFMNLENVVNIVQKNNLTKHKNPGIDLIVQFSPVLIYSLGKPFLPTNMAFFDIKVVNLSEKAVEVQITKIEFVDIKNNKSLVILPIKEKELLQISHINISRDNKFYVQPNSYQVLGYQWRSEPNSNIFELGQKAIAVVHYRINGQPETSVQSPPTEPGFVKPIEDTHLKHK